MAPSITEPTSPRGASASIPSTKALKLKDLNPFRTLVPLLTNPEITYLNASFSPPANHITASAITRFVSEALYTPNPKPGWLATANELRSLLAEYIHAPASSIALTRDTTEGLNSFIRGLDIKKGDNVVILDTEHPNHAYAWMALREEKGVKVRQVPTIAEAGRTGRVVVATAETFAPYVDERTVAIGLSSIMFHNGQWNEVQGICDAFRPRGIHVLVDVTQQVGFAGVDVTKLGVSAAVFSMHKGLHAPTGLAALYVAPSVIESVDPRPPIVGFGAVKDARGDLLVDGGEMVYHGDARRYEHLNLSLVGCVAAKAYLEFYLRTMGVENVMEHLYGLGDVLRRECGRLGLNVVGPEGREGHAPHLYVLDLKSGRWLEHLTGEGFYVSQYRLGIRVSFGFYNNVQDVERLALALEKGIANGIPMP
ncbi:pyridoxal phosphate-dependent transferase [Aspergillus karnatakaensis]|uniref:pyridoxal phosphate-dependent transferase n=1 Tax=Aspergillus karnatakaensis TaxID=1810916 RepID=UPI003CCDB405